MKLKIILAGAILCAITTTGAQAVTKCVAWDGGTTCTSDYSQYQYHTDWAATCTTNGVSTPISGIGICSSTSGSSAGKETATELDTSSTSDDNKYCWCRMISPAVSRWVFANKIPSANYCPQNCAYFCADYVQRIMMFRVALFGSLSD